MAAQSLQVLFALFFIHILEAIQFVKLVLKESAEGFKMRLTGIAFHSQTVRGKNWKRPI